ncbi:MAG: hypothetical protein J0I34_00210 [Pseudonocardia sp.]|uniref:hypothetical protein n=1 Tax=unclassified Pseudonocardia TaxID=2619320 RepID=UPI00086B5C75|nr:MULTISPECIES: hypothetical protein [unclassified Pseudonocardia]MBN9107178.1 hypothetical protein [Pseudonocardia sp.]ODU26933.1 MAG: hypothetical protein ABS80_04905 [Pseudonocardia sp. SCN 72-51]ODV05294.1 MAG: hypothetical protein ABT15_17490 [Pseudonocardia sp. SCN 73-27]
MFKSHCSTSKHHDDYKHCDDDWSSHHRNDWDDKYTHCWDNGRYEDDYCEKSSYSESHCHESYDKGCHESSYSEHSSSSSYSSHHVYS